MLRALLIDDDASALSDLRGILAARAGVTVVGEAATLDAARALLGGADYNVVFFDVQFAGGESFPLIPEVRPGASIIFAAAHGHGAARAFECHAVDYLLKPITPPRLAEALCRAVQAHRAAGARARPSPGTPIKIRQSEAPPERAGEVALTDHERMFLRLCLEAWEDSLPPTHLRSAEGEREVHYTRDREPTRLFIAGAPVSRLRRWWRALLGRLGA